MRYSSLAEFLPSAARLRRPVALIFAEDEVEVESTVAHHQQAGFSDIALFAPPQFALGTVEEAAVRVDYETRRSTALTEAVNAVIRAVPTGTWIYYCYNAEYLFFPFSENRSVRELLAFHLEERRAAMLTYVIDLYADDLGRWPNGVSLEAAHLDRAGYYAEARQNPDDEWRPFERQFDFFGGLRWRFEEHVPWERRKIDRISLFRALKGLELRADHTLSEPEMNTYACPWHNNLTAAVCSFRAAKALATNAASRPHVKSFRWHDSVPFEWRAQQLLDLGLIEPGQWF
jgi:hypothetical protein